MDDKYSADALSRLPVESHVGGAEICNETCCYVSLDTPLFAEDVKKAYENDQEMEKLKVFVSEVTQINQ